MSENIKKEIDIAEFCRRYDLCTSDEVKSKMLREIIYRTYCPVLEKKVALQTVLNKSVVTSNGITHIDYFLSKINFVLAVLTLYSKLKIAENDSFFNEYDMLYQRGLIDSIWEIIGKDELDELLNINGLVMDNYNEENCSINAYLTKSIDALGTTIGIFANEGINELLNHINSNK